VELNRVNATDPVFKVPAVLVTVALRVTIWEAGLYVTCAFAVVVVVGALIVNVVAVAVLDR
jgi:hypothetical protein